MAITRDQLSALAASASTSALAVTWSTNPTPGATVLVAVCNTSGQPSSVIDNGTSATTFTKDVGNNSGTYNIWLYRGNNIKLPSSGSYKVTVNVGTQSVTAAGISYLGVKSGAATATNAQEEGNNGPVDTLGATPKSTGALAFAAFCDFLSSGTDTITLTNASFTSQFTETNAASYLCGGVADWINPAGPSSMDCTWTISSSSPGWVGAIAVYDAAPTSQQRTILQAVQRSYFY